MNTELWYYLAVGTILASTLFAFTAASMPAVLQQGNYSGKAFLGWYYRRGNMILSRHALLTLCLLLLTALFNLCFSFFGYRVANLVSLLPFAGMCVMFALSGKRALKVPLKRTNRTALVFVIWWFLLAGVIFGMGVGFSYAAAAIGGTAPLFRYVPVTLTPLLFPVLYCIANALSKIYVVPKNARFIKKAKTALSESKCLKVGITGSFAKTTVKTMAATILSEKYRVIATPASFNTPLGIARTVQEQGLDSDIFLAEMGARHTGDIKELCEIVRPDVGVITGVCAQHVETFASLENVRAEKAVLAEYAKKTVLGASVGIYKEGAYCYGEDFAAEDIELTEHGTKFLLRLKEERIPVSTELLGRHAAEDIALATALCYLIGMTAEEIAAGIKKIQPVPHRLQKIEANGVTVLDDSYNCNEEGAKCAVEVLKAFPGRKFIVTPGIVELGILEREKNEALGKLLAGLDEVILVGETLVLPVRNGYLSAGGEEEKLKIVPTLKEAQNVLSQDLKEGDCVLFLNDLPDIYG